MSHFVLPFLGSRKWTRFWGRERAPRSDFCANVLAPVAEIGYRTVRERGHCHAEAERPPSFLSARLQTCKSDRCYRDAYRNNTSNVDRGSARLKRRRNVHWFRVSFSLHAHLVGTMDNRLGGAIHPLVFPLCVFLFVKYVFCRFLVCMPVAFRSTCDRLNASVKPLYTSRSLCVSQTSSRRPQPEHVDCNGAEKRAYDTTAAPWTQPKTDWQQWQTRRLELSRAQFPANAPPPGRKYEQYADLESHGTVSLSPSDPVVERRKALLPVPDGDASVRAMEHYRRGEEGLRATGFKPERHSHMILGRPVQAFSSSFLSFATTKHFVCLLDKVEPRN